MTASDANEKEYRPQRGRNDMFPDFISVYRLKKSSRRLPALPRTLSNWRFINVRIISFVVCSESVAGCRLLLQS